MLPRPKPKSPARTLASRSVAGTPLDRSPGKGPRSYAVIRHLRSPYSDLPDIGGHSTVQGIPFRHSGKAPPLAGSASPPDRPEAPPEWVYTGVCTFPLLYHVLDLRTCHSCELCHKIVSILLQCVNSGLFTKTGLNPASFSAPSLPSSDPQSVKVRLKKTNIFC